jgi:hypothetical protein
MATDSHAKSVHNTLSGTTADTVTITGFDRIQIINRDAEDLLYVSYNSTDTPTTAVAAADGTDVVLPLGFIEVDANGTEGGAVSVVGDGGAYSVVGVSA